MNTGEANDLFFSGGLSRRERTTPVIEHSLIVSLHHVKQARTHLSVDAGGVDGGHVAYFDARNVLHGEHLGRHALPFDVGDLDPRLPREVVLEQLAVARFQLVVDLVL
jgi:hypothetical protein